VRTPDHRISIYSGLLTVLICLLALGILAAPSQSRGWDAAASRTTLLGSMIHGVNAGPAEAPRAAAAQDAGPAAPPAAAPAAPKPVELPEGDGKAIATMYCQMCHKLTNLIKAHKDLDDWKDTIHTMIDRGSDLPDDKIDILAAYLAKNFGPKDAAPAAANAPAAAPAAATPPSTDAAAPAAPPAAPASAAAKPVELPDGDGKAIVMENCQMCHKLTNITKAHKSLDDWKDTVQTMIDRGANVPAEQIDTLVQYLAKNFGPKDASAPASAAPPSSTPAQ